MASLLVNWFGLSIDFVANAFRSLYNSTITPPPQSLPQLSQPLQFPMRNNKRSRKFAQTKANTRKHNCGKRVLRLDCLEKRYAFNVDWGLSYHNEAFPVDTNLDGVFSELDVSLVEIGLAQYPCGGDNRTVMIDFPGYPDVNGDSELTPIDLLFL